MDTTRLLVRLERPASVDRRSLGEGGRPDRDPVRLKPDTTYYGVLGSAQIRTTMFFVLTVLTASIGAAQTIARPESTLETVTPGTTVWLTDSGGREEKTRVVGISGDAITTDAGGGVQNVRLADVQRIEVRRSDSLLNGALIGAGAAVATGLFLCTRTEPWRNCRDDAGPIAGFAALGAGIGIGIDALIMGRRTVYEAPRGSVRLQAAPFAGGGAKGLQVSISF